MLQRQKSGGEKQKVQFCFLNFITASGSFAPSVSFFLKSEFSYEPNGRVRVRGRGEAETEHRSTQTSCYRMDGSYASHIASDDSIEWRSPDYTVRL